MSKIIRVLLEVPSDWISPDDPFLGLATFTRDRFETLLRDAVVEQALSNIEIPKVKITAKEIKSRMIEILAERALEER